MVSYTQTLARPCLPLGIRFSLFSILPCYYLAPLTGLSDCFNLNMLTNTIEDYVEYDPAAPVPSMSELTVKFSMKSNDKGLQSHYGTIISYGEC